MLKLNVYSKEGKVVDEKTLPPEIFEMKLNEEVIYEAVRMYQANKRQGTVSTKTRAEVRGGGRKPWRQKHTGRARAGTRSSPIWRGGGIVFGPKPRDYYYRIPHKKLRLALLSAISYKAKEGKIILLSDLSFPEPRTQKFVGMLQALGLSSKKRILFSPQKLEPNVYLSGRNIKNTNFTSAKDLNVFDVVKTDVMVFPLDGLEAFMKRMQPAVDESSKSEQTDTNSIRAKDKKSNQPENANSSSAKEKK
ncbi:50S ribosomal protein L4 [candidate division WOR-3 bacterium]|nr:50S ribosomal protein L4 [candidate division WOR-3 bacterium]